jgi:prophage antirepressor-like protein
MKYTIKMELIKSIDESFMFENKTVRVIGSYNEPWFVAKDICDILSLSNITESLKSLNENWKQVKNLTSVKLKSGISNQEQGRNMIFINEAGLYRLIMRSNKPIAQKFQEVVCEEILPSLRKKGEYKIQSIIDKNKALEEEKLKIEHEKLRIEEEKLRLEQENSRIEEEKLEIEEEKLRIEEEKLEIELQLEKKDDRIKKLQRETQIVDGHNVCYLCTADEKESEGIYTIGKATSLKKRLSDYNNNKLFNFKMVYYVSCKSVQLMDAVEKLLLSKLNKYKIISTRDVFQLPEGKDVSFFTQYFDIFKNLCDNIEEDLVLEERTTEELNELEHEINEKQPVKSSDEKKEKKKEYMKIYRKENAVHIAESKKKYNDSRKEIMEERINCVCGSIVTRQNMTTHLSTLRHKNFLETGKTVDESRKEDYIKCGCGMSISKRSYKRHENSIIHKSYLKSQNNSMEIEAEEM